MYALIQTADQGSLWRSDDGGATWKVVSWDRSLIGRAGYYIRLAVNPQNPDDVLISNSSFHRSTDGGKTFSGNGGGGRVRGRRAAATATTSGSIRRIRRRYVLTDDGGASITTPTGQPISVSLPNGQMYHVAIDNRVPYWIYSNRQDDGTMRGPSTVSEATGNGRLPDGSTMPQRRRTWRTRRPRRGRRRAADAARRPRGRWRCAGRGARRAAGGRGGGGGGGRGGGGGLQWQPNIGGCESGFTIPDPTDANIVWATLLRQQAHALGRAHAARRGRSSRG